MMIPKLGVETFSINEKIPTWIIVLKFSLKEETGI